MQTFLKSIQSIVRFPKIVRVERLDSNGSAFSIQFKFFQTIISSPVQFLFQARQKVAKAKVKLCSLAQAVFAKFLWSHPSVDSFWSVWSKNPRASSGGRMAAQRGLSFPRFFWPAVIPVGGDLLEEPLQDGFGIGRKIPVLTVPHLYPLHLSLAPVSEIYAGLHPGHAKQMLVGIARSLLAAKFGDREKTRIKAFGCEIRKSIHAPQSRPLHGRCKAI